MGEVRVNLGAASYTIHIASSIINETGRFLSGLKLSKKALVVTDDNVGPLYGSGIIESLKAAGFLPELYSVAPGEDSKSLETAMKLYTKAIEMGLDRHSPLIALGGGVVGDLTGFVAATYLRGVPFIQIPTTLLAQVDSSVGGKTGVNHQLGKNLIGAFYQPQTVIIDTEVLRTLPARELSAGLAEVVKYGAIADKSLLEYLIRNDRQILGQETQALTEIIGRSCQIKANVVEQDEKESHLRMILNFGHTIAHAIEGSTGYNRYNHGEAVAVGMHGAALISHYMGLCDKEAVDVLCDCMARFSLPLAARDCSADELAVFLTRDKKNIGGKINWVLLKEIGEVIIESNVPEDIIRRVLVELTAG